MVKKSLLDVAFSSAKRKHTLLLLDGGPKSIESLMDSLETTRQALLPQMKILEESYLVSKDNGTYSLSTMGKMFVKRMKPLLETLETLDEDISYWGRHNIDFIPSHLLKRINELRSCKVITPPLSELYDINRDFFEQCNRSGSLTLMFTFLYPNFPEIYDEWISNNVYVKLIVSGELFERIKANYVDKFREYMKSGLFEIFVYDHPTNFVSFGHNDYCSFFRLLSRKGDYDNKQLMCCSSSAVQWNRELCEYYLERSTRITEL